MASADARSTTHSLAEDASEAAPGAPGHRAHGVGHRAHGVGRDVVVHFHPVPVHLKEVAESNINTISVTLDTFQLLSGWLKELAPANISPIFVTLDTFHLLSGWLKDSAP